MNKHLITIALITAAGLAQANDKAIEDAIKTRQAGYAYMAWNMGKIKANMEGEYNKAEVIKAANTIQAIANSGMGALYVKGSDKGSGFHETKVKPELFTNQEQVGKLATNFVKEANTLADVAKAGGKEAVATQFGKVGAACKACHDDFRLK